MAKSVRFVFSVRSFSKEKEKGGTISSSVRLFSGFDWSAAIYPSGNLSGKGTHVSFYLRCHGPTDACRTLKDWQSPECSVSFAAIREKRSYAAKKFGPRCFSQIEEDWGFKEWFPFEQLEGKDSLLNDDGSLDIEICIKKAADNSELGTEAEERYEPSMISMLDDPEASYADVRLSGNDGRAPIRAHRAILGYRAKYFQKLFDFTGSTANLGKANNKAGSEALFNIADLTTKALVALVRRIYGEHFPGFLTEEDHLGTLLMIWHFATVGLVDGLPEECVELVKGAVSKTSFASCYHMAVLLDDTSVLKILAAKISGFDAVAQDIVEALTLVDMHSLLSHAPPGLIPLVWADLWVKDNEERECFGEALFKSFQVDKLSASKYGEMAALDIASKYAPRDCLVELLLNCHS